MTSEQQSYIKGVYAITPSELDTKLLVAKVVAALKGGVSILQYRNKAAGQALRLRQATALLAACRTYGVPLIINDHLDLCAQIDADGVHLGAADPSPGPVRRLLGADAIIGVSCYDQLSLAQAAETEGADYVTFGSCFPSESKPSVASVSLRLFEQAQQVLNIPAVGIGGISLENAKLVKAAGAAAIAMTHHLFDAEDVETATQQFNSIYQSS